jgi:hypothetical protein
MFHPVESGSIATATYAGTGIIHQPQEVTMIQKLRYALLPLLGAVSLSAVAAPHLTPQQCHDYPFVRLHHEVTHAELVQEVQELEAVGYEPYADDDTYPVNVQAAEQRLHAEYQHDCLPQQTAAAPQG